MVVFRNGCQTFHRAPTHRRDDAVKVLGLSGSKIPAVETTTIPSSLKERRSDRSRWAYGGAGFFLPRQFHRDQHE
jgi:hypothetical protein